ncbi:hypothetical protein ACLOJK_010569 [Asimina triloba]
MEEKQLDFNAPLLSVRRITLAAASPAEESKRNGKLPNRPFPLYRSNLKSGPVRNAGAVPFQWEQTPGRPKDGSEMRSGTPEKPPLVPKLPPGRVLEHRQSSLAKQAVGKEQEASTQTRVRQPDKLISCPDPRSSGGNVTLLESPELGAKKEDDSDSDDHDDEAFSDALDTLSRTDSQFMNCSLSGLSALDGPGSRFSGNISTDSRARDFMIDRFLPAAVAMASETPQYLSRKQPVVREAVKSVTGDRKPPPYQCRPRIVPHQTHDVEIEDSESEDEDYDDSGNMTAKACGLLPRFCLKSSFCLLNPVPGMKIRNSIPLSPVGRRLHTRTGPVLSRYLTDSIHEHTWEAVFDHKLAHGIELPEAHENGSKPTSDSNRLTYWSDSQTPDGSSPYRRCTGDGISSYRNETPRSPFHEGMGFLGMPKLGKNFKSGSGYMDGKVHNDYRETLSQESSKHGSSSGSPSVEKTLYVDSFQMLETPNSRSSSSDTKDVINSAEKDVNINVEGEKLQKNLVLATDVDSSNGIKLGKEQDILQNTITDIVEVNHSSRANGSTIGGDEKNAEDLRCDDALDQKVRSLEFSRALVNENPSLDDLQNSKERDEGNGYTNSLQSPLPPPLPKSPSESWLWRTLPVVSSTNPSHRPYLGIQFRSMRHVEKSSSPDPKWETMVKTAVVHHGHSRFSEELKTPGSKQSMLIIYQEPETSPPAYH